MIRYLMLAVLLTGCGMEQSVEWNAPISAMPAMDLEYKGLMIRLNDASEERVKQAVDLAESVLGTMGLEIPADVDVSYENVVQFDTEAGKAVGYWKRSSEGRDEVRLNVTGQALLHELLHVIDHRAGIERADGGHAGWDANGYNYYSNSFAQNVPPVR